MAEIGIMVTNGGPHSAEKWAETTSSHIVTITDSIAGERRGAAIKLQAAVIDILMKHHITVQEGERAAITKFGVARLQHDMTPNDHVNIDAVVVEIVAAGQGTPWQDSFNYQGQEAKIQVCDDAGKVISDAVEYRPSFKKYLTDLLTDHFMQNAFIERSWHSDKNIHTPEGQAFRKQFHQGAKS